MNIQELKSLGWTLLALLFVRAFVAEPYKIPSGSMIPTLLIGDHILVSKSSYDLRLPFTDIQLVRVADPKRGDVVVFKYPNYEENPLREGDFFIKRLIGVPGDVISIKGGIISINNETIERIPLEATPFPKETPQYKLTYDAMALFQEQLPDMTQPHILQQNKAYLDMLPQALRTWERISGKTCIDVGLNSKSGEGVPDPRLMNSICEFKVPVGNYFFVGDNRDDSSDGRAWGFVERTLIKGKALFIWLPWKSRGYSDDWAYVRSSEEGEGGPFLRWKRVGLRIQ